MTPDRSPRTIKLLTVLILFGTFLSGIAVGVGAAAFSGRRPPWGRPLGRPPFMPGIGPGELSLSPDQETKARTIAERYRPEMEVVLRESFPKMRALNEKMETEMRAILTDEQRARFDLLKARRPPMDKPGRLGPPPRGPGFPGQLPPPPPMGMPFPPPGEGHPLPPPSEENPR